MSIILFGILGAALEVGVWYWILLSVYAIWKMFKYAVRIGNALKELG